MGLWMEGVMAVEPGIVERLTPRQLEVVLLLGRDKLNYKTAATRMRNKLVRTKRGQEAPSISYRTVRHYACEIRDLMESDLSPIRAVLELWYEHKDELEEAVV